MNNLIEVIYAALLGETDWQQFVDKLNAVAPEAQTSMLVHDRIDDSSALGFVAGITGREAAVALYESHYCKLNPWMTRAEAMPVGRGIIGEHLVNRRVFETSEYYADYLRYAGLETGFGLAIIKDKSRFFVLNVLTGDRDIDRNLERADNLTALAPHLRRAFNVYRSQVLRPATLELSQSLSAALGLAVILIDENLRVLKASSEGEAALVLGNWVGLNPLAQLQFVSAAHQDALRHLLKRGAVDRIYEDLPAGLRLIRVGGNDASEFFAGPMVAIILNNGGGTSNADLTELAHRYRLTPAESRVFSAIACGMTVTNIAEAAGISRETVRSQLKAIYAKTETHSQSDLIRLATGTMTADSSMKLPGTWRMRYE